MTRRTGALLLLTLAATMLLGLVGTSPTQAQNPTAEVIAQGYEASIHGDKIAFIGEDKGLYTVNADGTGLSQAHPGPATETSWENHNTLLFFLQDAAAEWSLQRLSLEQNGTTSQVIDQSWSYHPTALQSEGGVVVWEVHGGVHLFDEGRHHVVGGENPVLMGGYLFLSNVSVVMRSPASGQNFALVPLETARGTTGRPVKSTHAFSPQNNTYPIFIDETHAFVNWLLDGWDQSIVLSSPPQRGAWFVDAWQQEQGDWLVLTDSPMGPTAWVGPLNTLQNTGVSCVSFSGWLSNGSWVCNADNGEEGYQIVRYGPAPAEEPVEPVEPTNWVFIPLVRR